MIETLEDRRVLTAPTLSGLTATSPINENDTTTLTGLIVDPDVGQTHSLQIDWGDGTVETVPFAAGQFNINQTHQYLDNPTGSAFGSFTVNLTVTDSNNETGTGSTSVEVDNVSPTLTNLAATATQENGFTTLTGKINDPGTKDSFTLQVNWGDSTPLESFTFGAGTTDFDLTHQYLDNNGASPTFTINLTVTDKDGGSSSNSTTVMVSNVTPTLSGLSATSINEGATTTLSGFILDQGTLDSFTLNVNWGDGTTPDTFTFPAGTTTFDVDHTYAHNNGASPTFTVNLTVTDSDGASTGSSTTVAVNNVAPTLSGLGATDINEGGTTTLTGFILDQGVNDSFTLNVNWGDGTTPDTFTFPAGTTSFDVEHTYADNNGASPTFTINLTVTDNDGASTSSSTTVAVSNVAPTLSGLSTTSINEGGTTTLSGFILDQGVNDSFTLNVNWGDGTPVENFTFGAGTSSFDLEHTYADNNGASPTFPVSLTVTDKDNASTSASTTVAVSNVAPTLSGLDITPVNEGGTATLSGFIVDQGALDTFTMKVNWGDGTPDETFTFDAGTTSFDVVHTYTMVQPGFVNTFFPDVNITVTDKDAASGTALIKGMVSNVAPTLSGLSIDPVNEGGTAMLSGFVLDPGILDSFTLSINWGDGTPLQSVSIPAGDTTFNVPHVYIQDSLAAPNAVFAISLQVTDANSGTSNASTTVAVANVAPMLTNLSTTPINEGSQTTLRGTIVDPGKQDTFTLMINWGDGTALETKAFPANTTTFAVPHTYAHHPTGSSTFPINLTIKDSSADNGNNSSTASTSVTVSNVAPTVTLSGPTMVVPAATFTVNLSYSDPGGVSVSKVVISWGDGTTSTFSGQPTSATHAYRRINANYVISASVTDADGTVQAANTLSVKARFATTNQAYVAELYQDLLLREADPDGLALFSGQLDRGFTRTQVATGFVTSTEYRRVVVNGLYTLYLHRAADPGGLDTFVNFLANGGTITQVRSALVGSAEYFASRGGNKNAGFLNALYIDAFGRMPDPGAVSTFLPALNSGVSRTQIAATIFSSDEFRTGFVNAQYKQFLGRNADPTGLNDGLTFLRNGGREEFYIAMIVGSTEYLNSRVVL